MLEILDPHNTRHLHLRGSFLQAQISNQPISHTRGSSNSGSSTPHGHSPRHHVPTPKHLYPQIAWRPPRHLPQGRQLNPSPIPDTTPAHTSKGAAHANPLLILRVLLMTSILQHLTRKLKFGIKTRKLRVGIKVRRKTD